MTGAFEGVRVLDLSQGLSGAYAARLFGDHGADVILVEPESGHALRAEPGFVGDQSGAESSLLHAYGNWNKRSVRNPSAAVLAELVATADIIVTTAVKPWDTALTLPLNDLPAHVVHVSITPHGLTGSLAQTKGNHLTHCARTGWSNLNRLQEEPPLQLPVRQSGYIAGVAGFVAAAAAYLRAVRDGVGELVDVSEMEVLASTSAPWAILGLFTGSPRLEFGPGGLRYRGVPGFLFETRDGLMNYGFPEWAKWQQSMQLFGLDEIGADPLLQPVLGRHQQDLRPVVAELAVAAKLRDKWPLFHSLAKLHCIAGVVQNTRELLENEQLKAREYFTVTTVAGREVAVPGASAKLHSTPVGRPQPAPALPAVGASISWSTRRARRVAAKAADVRTQPLAGVRVLCFTQAWSGTWGTEILSLLGADVVQIEGRRRPDVWRGPGSPIGREVLNEAIPQNPLNTNGMFNSVNLNKRAVTLDMTVPEGREIFWRLVPRFDVVCENFSPKVMANWGITLETLRASRPDIIFGSISGYGHTGPTAMYPANGNTTEPMAGLSSINGYVGDAGSNTGGFIPDPVSGYHFAAAVIAALVHRARTGAGQRIDCAMVEAVAVQLGDAVLEYSVNGNITKPAGNRHPRIAPHSMYPAAGDDWVAIAAETEPQWQALATLVGIDATGFGDMAARKSREAELDALIAAWTRDQDATRLEGLLTSHGIVAARVRPFLDIYRQPDPDLLSRGYLQQVTHPETGAHYMPTLPWRLHRTPAPEVRYSPCFGEHSENVFGEELGMTAADYQRLESRGITGKTRL